MMFRAVSLVFALGMVAGVMLLRRGWLRTWLFLLALTLVMSAILLLGIVPPALLPANESLAVALLLTPTPLAAGLLCGGLLAWLLRRITP